MFLTWAVLAVLWRAPEQRADAPPPRLSIAVLPFRDLSDDRCCDYLADAISDDLTTELSLIPGSVVIARESSDVYRGHPAPAGEIGRKLGVRYLLEGSLRAVDGAFSINAQLIEAAGGTHLWAERFTVPRARLADAQTAIVQRLSSALGVKLVDIEGARSVRERPDDPDAMDLFLRARSVLDRSDSLQAMQQAQALLEAALAKQPDDISALAELGWLAVRKLHNFVTPSLGRDEAKARAVIARAVALAPADPLVLDAQAALEAYDGNCAAAELTYRLALEHQANAVRPLSGLAVCKITLGQFTDAVRSLTELLRIDPEGARERTWAYQIGFAYLMMDDPHSAIPWLRKSIAGEPDPAPGSEEAGRIGWDHLCLVAALRMAGDLPAAQAAFLIAHHAWPGLSLWQLGARSPRTFSALPGFQRLIAALKEAGMPPFASPPRDGAGPGCTEESQSAIQTIDTRAVADLLHDGKATVIDFGTAAAVPLGAKLRALDASSLASMDSLAVEAHGNTIVAMGSGVADPAGCEAARQLSHHGRVLWYGGGEEAWAQAGLPARDQR